MARSPVLSGISKPPLFSCFVNVYIQCLEKCLLCTFLKIWDVVWDCGLHRDSFLFEMLHIQKCFQNNQHKLSLTRWLNDYIQTKINDLVLCLSACITFWLKDKLQERSNYSQSVLLPGLQLFSTSINLFIYKMSKQIWKNFHYIYIPKAKCNILILFIFSGQQSETWNYSFTLMSDKWKHQIIIFAEPANVLRPL